VKLLEIRALSDSEAEAGMTENQKSRQKSWFEKNPKKTLAMVLLSLLVALTYGAEKLLGRLNHSHNLVLFSEKRYINLREFPPNLDVTEVPQEKTVRESDGLVRQAYRVRTDARGFLLPYHQYDHPDATLVFLGGSTTACVFMEEENRFPYLVGNLLEQMTGKKITSINGGVSGNNSLHSIDVLLNKVIPLQPDVVVLMHNINDLISLAYYKTYWNRNPSRAPIVDFTFYKNLKGLRALSTLARDLYLSNLHVATRVLSKKIFGKSRDEDDEFAQVRGKRLELDQDVLIHEFKMNLEIFINICRARKITPVLMTQFSRIKADPDAKVKRALQGFASDTKITVSQVLDTYGKFNEAIVAVGRANGVLVIDLAHLIPQEKQYMYDVVHLNPEGSRLASRVISDRLKPLVAP
jgi:lysophospholipase L1-like esterase